MPAFKGPRDFNANSEAWLSFQNRFAENSIIFLHIDIYLNSFFLITSHKFEADFQVSKRVNATILSQNSKNI